MHASDLASCAQDAPLHVQQDIKYKLFKDVSIRKYFIVLFFLIIEIGDNIV
jgi:hypothetical protein